MWRTQTQNADASQTNTGTVAFLQSEPLSSNSFCSFEYARGNESIIYFTDLGKPIETYIYARNKHPNAANLRLQTYDKNQWTFCNNTARASTLALAIIVKIQILLQKFPFLLRYTTPWLKNTVYGSCGTPS